MCLKIKETFKTRAEAREFTKAPLIAKKDIVVYKILVFYENKYYSPYRSVQYYKNEIKHVKKFSFNIVDICGKWHVDVNKGLHSHKKLVPTFPLSLLTSTKTNYFVVKCIIPKGTFYFKNNNEEYVSLSLVMPKEFKNLKYEFLNSNRKKIE